jgi:hypothetical protein
MKKTRKPLIFLGLMAMILSGCVQKARPPRVMEPIMPVYALSPAETGIPKTLSLPDFDQVVISGPVNVTIKGRQSQNQLIARGMPEALKEGLSVNVREGVLSIAYKNPLLHSSPMTVEVDAVAPIHQLRFQGNGTLSLDKVGDESMVLKLSGNTTTRMTGMLVLSRIDLTDNAVLHAYWINSSNLRINASNRAKVFLAGIVTHLNIIASGDADVDAKNLRAENAYVRTRNDADVSVSVKKNLSSFSTERSSVYYYRDSELGLHYLNQNGSALRMKGIPQSQ